ncbi:hypothetical protein ACN6K9_002610 [Streptomyces sp. SAS_267]|uniref:hypothetical protein n=1 Tax=Streptomyces sp. SAS_267 TaxID=3412750 RepID=UPI00403C454F
MNADEPTTGTEDADMPAIPWFGPTLHELVPDAPPGTRPPILHKQVGPALARVRKDPVAQERIRRADRASRGAVASLVAEMLTPPLPRHNPEELP